LPAAAVALGQQAEYVQAVAEQPAKQVQTVPATTCRVDQVVAAEHNHLALHVVLIMFRAAALGFSLMAAARMAARVAGTQAAALHLLMVAAAAM
jgi:hypothetical protein